MQTIGLIGGMSWESSLEYYRILNEKVKDLLGGFSSCKCLMYSVDFAEIETLQHKDEWAQLDKLMADAAVRLYKGGADMIVLCTNTMHLCSEAIVQSVPIPFLHIAEATGEEIVKHNLKKVGLLGTNFTMTKDFYKEVLTDKYGIETIIPNEQDREQIHRIIYEELVLGKILPESRETYKAIIKRLQDNGAEGIILGCTEIPLLISKNDVDLPIFDTTRIHAEKAVEWAMR
ncbi:MAG: aspartate/glutamate racemase family protein [Bacteroidetes bacterium]|nr:MAG: aspartate/glutamate racemase family protein [Bacteroidota bacterium]